MGLRMKNFNILGVHWKIRLLGGISQKTNIGQFAGLRGGSWYPDAHHAQEPWHPGEGARPDCVIQLNCGKVHTHASFIKQPEHRRTSTTKD